MLTLKDIETELTLEEINICFMALTKFSNGPICGPHNAMYYYRVEHTIKILEKTYQLVLPKYKTQVNTLISRLKKLNKLALV